MGFLDKNKDSLYQDFKRLLYNRYVNLHFDFSIRMDFCYNLINAKECSLGLQDGDD